MDNCEVSEFDNMESNEDLINLERSKYDSLKMKVLAGGSIINYRPLYSPNGEFLFVICKNIQIYSVSTGELLKVLEGAKHDIIGFEYEIGNNNLIVACTESGEIIKWKWQSGAIENKVKLNLTYKILSFNLLNVSANSLAFITFAKPELENKIHWMIVDINTGKNFYCPLKITLSSSKLSL